MRQPCHLAKHITSGRWRIGHDERRQQSGDDCNRLDQSDELPHALARDPADGDQRDTGGKRARVRSPQSYDANHGVRVLFRRSLEDRAERDVRRARREGGIQLLHGVRGDSNTEPRGEPSKTVDGHVRLPDMREIATGEDGEVRSIIRDEWNPGAMTHWSQLAEQAQGLARWKVLRAQLDRCGRGLQDGRGERDGVEPTRVQRADVDDRVKSTHRSGCVIDGA